MKQLLILLCFVLAPMTVLAGTNDFLAPHVNAIHSSVICSGSEPEQCHAVFFIRGKNFLNSNGQAGVLVGETWAEILRWEDDLVVASASEELVGLTPKLSIDTTVHRPFLRASDDVLTQMFEESVDVALASIKTHTDGTRYIVAGPKYGNPERTYYRDSYWTSGMILMIEPYVIRDQILLLARGIEVNGAAPSAIPVDENDVKIPLWTDHHDSGPYFVMMVHDYIRWTGDTSVLHEQVNGRSVFTIMEDAVTYLSTQDSDGDLMPEKSEGSLQDWLDSIPRSGEVFSNQVLYYRALRNLVDLAGIMEKPTHAKAFHRQSILLRYMINKQFWNEEGGYYYERCSATECIDRITNESSLALLYDLVPSENQTRFLKSLTRLETRSNPAIAHGDWGVVNAWPLYEGFTPYDYHNATDWPFLDGMNAGARLKHGDDGWYYPLTRWWTFNEEHWPERSLPEYVSPVDEDAGDLQAWSVNPIVSLVRYGFGIDPALNGSYDTSHSPMGDARIENIVIRGKRTSLDIRAASE